MKLHIIAPALPPLLDGIGDYTAALTGHIAGRVDATLLTGEGFEATPIAGARIVPAFRPDVPKSVGRIGDIARRERPDWLLLQYNPFAYGKWGLNLHLPRVLRGIKKDCPDLRLAVMCHETFVPVIDWKFAVMGTWQRLQLWQLGQAADVLLFSVQPWAQRFQKWFPGKPIAHLPVSSNIARVPLSRLEARSRLGFTEDDLVVGLFGRAHASRMLPLMADTLHALRQAGHKITLLYIGPDETDIRAHCSEFPLRLEGALPGDEVSRRFAAMDLYLAPFVDGVSTRRTSLMTALQHGIAIVGNPGVWTDDLLIAEDGKAFLLADTSQPDAFQQQARRAAGDAQLRAKLGRGATELFAREFTWKRISDHLLGALAATEQGETLPVPGMGQPVEKKRV